MGRLWELRLWHAGELRNNRGLDSMEQGNLRKLIYSGLFKNL